MAINRRILYVDNCGSILTPANPTARSGLKAWCAAKGITALKWLCTGQSPANMDTLRILMEDMRTNTSVIDHQYSRNGVEQFFVGTVNNPAPAGATNYSWGAYPCIQPGGSTKVNESDQLAANQLQRFFCVGFGQTYRGSGIDFESPFWSAANPWNFFGANTLPIAESNADGMDPWTGGTPPNVFPYGETRKDCGTTALFDGFDVFPGFPMTAANAAVGTMTRLDVAAYTNDETLLFPISQYRLTALADAAAACAANPFFYNQTNGWGTIYHPPIVYDYQNYQFDFLPVFDIDPAYLGTVCNALGTNRTFDDVFNTYLADFQAWNYVNKQYLKEPDGYVLRSYSTAFNARPSMINP